FNENDSPHDPGQRLQRCLKRDVVHGRMGSDWREVQANMGMAALLMPRPLFVAASRNELMRLGASRVETDTPDADAIAGRLARAFQVSRQAAMIRMKTLEVLAAAGEKHLI